MMYEALSSTGSTDATLNARAQSIATHLATRISACSVESSPFQHFFFAQAFPDDVYAEMRARMPERARYLPLNIDRWKNAAGISTRDRLCLSDGDIERVEPEHQQFWSDITDALLAPAVQRAAYSVLREDVAIRLGCPPQDVERQPAYASVMMVRDFEDYRLKPHPDGRHRVVTMMFYLADPDSPTDLGTSLYRERSALARIIGRRFEEVKRFPFLPNSVGAFAVNDCTQRRSWHGRERIEGVNVIRDSIIVSYLSEKNAEFGKKHNY